MDIRKVGAEWWSPLFGGSVVLPSPSTVFVLRPTVTHPNRNPVLQDLMSSPGIYSIGGSTVAAPEFL